MNIEDINSLGDVLYHARRSRRQAKHFLHDSIGDGSAAMLDRILAFIASHPQRAAIEARADELTTARQQREHEARQRPLGGLHDEWFIAEGLTGRQYIIYVGSDTAFVGEIFSSRHEAPRELEGAALDEGCWLANILWLDDEPAADERTALYQRARVALREYDLRKDAELNQ